MAALPAKAKVARLKKLFAGRRRALICTHDNPDPDSMAAAWALKVLLEARVGLTGDVAYGGIIGRAENAAFVKLLHVPIVPIEQLSLDDYDTFALLDTQQTAGNHALPAGRTADIVIDHHPLRDEDTVNPFADLGGAYGATSTLLTEYLRAARLEPSPELATALYYGIKADTRDLGRQTRQPDVDSYLWLFPRVDLGLLRAIEHPKRARRYFAVLHGAIERARLYGEVIITDLGAVDSPDMVADVAERFSFIDGLRWSLAFGAYGDHLYLSLRVTDQRMNAGRLIRETCAPLGGSAGGHGSMAGARVPLSGGPRRREAVAREVVRRFKEAFGVQKLRGTALLA